LDFDSYVPGLSISAAAVLHGLILTACIAALAGFVLSHCKSSVLRVLLFLASSIALVRGWGSPADFLKQWLAQLVFLAVVVFGIGRVVRMNLLGYFLVLATPSFISGAQELLPQPNSFYRTQGYLVLAMLLLLLLWPIIGWLSGRDSPRAEP